MLWKRAKVIVAVLAGLLAFSRVMFGSEVTDWVEKGVIYSIFSTEQEDSSAHTEESTVYPRWQLPYTERDVVTPGIDVSDLEGHIDWQTVANEGIKFAIIRAGYRDSYGKLCEDKRFSYNLRGAKEAGLMVGVYFDSQATTPAEAEEEANFVCELLNGEDLFMQIFFVRVDSCSWWPTLREIPLTECARAFCQTVEAWDYRGGIFFTYDTGYNVYNLYELQNYAFWLYSADELPDYPHVFDYIKCGQTTIDGIEGTASSDVCFGR